MSCSPPLLSSAFCNQHLSLATSKNIMTAAKLLAVMILMNIFQKQCWICHDILKLCRLWLNPKSHEIVGSGDNRGHFPKIVWKLVPIYWNLVPLFCFFVFAKLVSTNLLSPFPSFRDGAMFVKSFLVFNEIPFNEQPVRSLNGLRMLT